MWLETEKVISSGQSEARKKMWRQSWESFILIFRSSTLFIWFVIFLLALLEIKRYYNIDVIPNYNSSIDDMYGMLRGTISEFFKSF